MSTCYGRALALLFASATRQVTARGGEAHRCGAGEDCDGGASETEISDRFGEWLAHREVPLDGIRSSSSLLRVAASMRAPRLP